jgi:hexose oxidase
METHVKERELFTRRAVTAGSIASLLAITGKPRAEARAQFVAAADGKGGADLVVLDPNSPRFAGLTQGFNRRWSAPNCSRILVPLTEAGAHKALDKAISWGPGNFRVRGGGHCYEDFVFSDRTQALIDMSLLNEIGLDARNGVYYAQSGSTTWDLYRQLYWRFGLTLPGGSCYSVGLGGHICGGGYGLLSRQFGLTVDWLTGVHVVTVSDHSHATFNHATKQSDRGPIQDLYWAHTGGGGGNFGLVTRYEFAALPRAPQHAELFTLSWSWADTIIPQGVNYLIKIIRCFEHLTHMMPPAFFGLLKLTHKKAGKISLVIQYAYDGMPGSSTIKPQLEQALRQFGVDDCVAAADCAIIGHPVYLTCPVSYQNLPWWEAVQTLNDSGPNRNGKYKSAYMRDSFPSSQIQTIYDYLTLDPVGNAEHIDMSQSLLQVDSYGGQINTVAPQATAVWQRSSIFKLQYQTYWQDVESGPSTNGEVYLRWIRDFYGAMYDAYGRIPDPLRDRTNNVDGCYVNYPDTDLNNYGGLGKALSLYYGGNLPRLIRAKRKWDPLNYFQNSQSIPVS